MDLFLIVKHFKNKMFLFLTNRASPLFSGKIRKTLPLVFGIPSIVHVIW